MKATVRARLWVVVVQSLSRVRLFTAACQTPVSSTVSWTLLKFTFIESVMPSNHPILCPPTIPSSVTRFSFCPQSVPASGSFPVSQRFAWGGQSIGASASASVLPVNIQDWFPLGLTGLIFLQSKGLSKVFSSTTIQKHQFFSAQPSMGYRWY